MNELGALSVTGLTVYAVLRTSATLVYRTDSQVFETEVDGNYANYAITMTEQGTTGVYYGTMPLTGLGGIPGDYNYIARIRVGGTPALSDPAIGSRDFSWNGAIVVSIGTANPTGALSTLQAAVTDLGTAVTDVQTDVDDLQTTAAGLATLSAQTTMQAAVTDIQTDVDEVQTTVGTLATAANLTTLQATATEIADDTDAILAGEDISFGVITAGITALPAMLLATTVPLNATAGTIGRALLVAEGVGIGKLVEDDVANTLTLYARDNTTVLRVFNLVPSGVGALSRQ